MYLPFAETLLWSLALPSRLSEILDQNGVDIGEFEHGRGLKTLRHREIGDILLSVPASYALSKGIVLETYTHLNDLKCNLTDTQIMALGVLNLKEENSIIVCTLPETQHSIPLMPGHIITCLPPAYQKIVDNIRKYYVQVYEKVCAEESAFSKSISSNDFFWAIASVQSRSFKSDDGECRVMIPGIDLINHKFGDRAAFMSYNPDELQYEVRACVPLSKGDEITISYGDIDNLNLLINFGFCIPNNPQRIIFFDLDDILLAAQSLIPNIFPDVIIKNFKSLLNEEKKYPDLFEYDGIVGPRACLKQASLVVRHLGEKLAEMKLDGLEDAIFQRILVRRKQELLTCLIEMDTIVLDDEWKPFLSSIYSLVKDEIQILS